MKRSMSVIDLTLGEGGGISCGGSNNGGGRKWKCTKLSIPAVIAPLTREAYSNAYAPRPSLTSSQTVVWNAASSSSLSSNQDEAMDYTKNSPSRIPHGMHSGHHCCTPPRQVTPVPSPRRVVRFSPFVSFQTIPSIQDIDLNEKRRLYYNNEEMARMAIDEKIRRRLYVLSKWINYEQSRRLQHRLNLMNSHKITTEFHKVCTQHHHQQQSQQQRASFPQEMKQNCGFSPSTTNKPPRSFIAAAA